MASILPFPQLLYSSLRKFLSNTTYHIIISRRRRRRRWRSAAGWGKCGESPPRTTHYCAQCECVAHLARQFHYVVSKQKRYYDGSCVVHIHGTGSTGGVEEQTKKPIIIINLAHNLLQIYSLCRFPIIFLSHFIIYFVLLLLRLLLSCVSLLVC